MSVLSYAPVGNRSAARRKGCVRPGASCSPSSVARTFPRCCPSSSPSRLARAHRRSQRESCRSTSNRPIQASRSPARGHLPPAVEIARRIPLPDNRYRWRSSGSRPIVSRHHRHTVHRLPGVLPDSDTSRDSLRAHILRLVSETYVLRRRRI
ncbi:hypothetical protein BD309DRAFT_351146 [Dichomitus squalens]|nr:hypothetical protein BD309DRAFT_351146 [Dichomitus squalens]